MSLNYLSGPIILLHSVFKNLISESYNFSNRQYTLLSKLSCTDNNARPTGGASILVRKDIPYSTLALDSPLQAVACRIS
jgi:hypothetical protein